MEVGRDDKNKRILGSGDGSPLRRQRMAGGGDEGQLGGRAGEEAGGGKDDRAPGARES